MRKLGGSLKLAILSVFEARSRHHESHDFKLDTPIAKQSGMLDRVMTQPGASLGREIAERTNEAKRWAKQCGELRAATLPDSRRL